ncbi:LysM peptidoglycan-binding domain-containing protein [Parabacteroides sp. OttesenSCG-928-G07]|nr:LysM peptidoglycan-binding domain-containing protein [Parabacteroides sp. OttesenSCG-928-G21]MDL2278556.1 LysM peptidoglycan-binding domain-containing protein [Parabacteroides sp. OttesenSCG-928-G07]
MKKLFIFISLCCFASTLFAQEEVAIENETEMAEQQYSVLSSDPTVAEIGLIPESLDANVDSLLRSWHVQYFSKVDDYCHDDDKNVVFDETVYEMRLKSLPNIISLPYNKMVRDCINLYAEKRRGLVGYMLGMADYYFPIIEQVLDEYNLPLELKYLVVVESALNPLALSRVGAAGLWQFMLPTGKSYGLEINSLVDERRDPVMATHAACRYFMDMYTIYEDWNLVLAAYNCGPGNVNKALRRANGKTDFWGIYPYLPRETRSYVPLFIAANYIMNFYCEHNICPIQTDLPLATDTIMVNKMLHFEQVSEVLNLDIELIRALNPQYKRDIVPGNALKSSVLKLPAFDTYSFVNSEDAIFLHRAEELLADCISYDPADETRTVNTQQKITHVARTGETVNTIADKYGVNARDIRRWNGLSTNRVGNGRRLTVYVNNGGVRFASAAQTPTPAPLPEEKKIDESGKTYITYTVQSGDSLYSISKQYPGISAANLQQVNNLPNANIRPGQVLKIPVS